MEAIEAEAELLDECDVIVPRQIAKYMKYVSETAKSYDFIISFGHAGIEIFTSTSVPMTWKNKISTPVALFLDDIYSRRRAWRTDLRNTESVAESWTTFANFPATRMRLMKGIKEVFDRNDPQSRQVCFKLN